MEVRVLTQKELRMLNWSVLYDGILFWRGPIESKGFKLYLLKKCRVELKRIQRKGHFGKAKMHAHVKCKFYWPKMQKNVMLGKC